MKRRDKPTVDGIDLAALALIEKANRGGDAVGAGDLSRLLKTSRGKVYAALYRLRYRGLVTWHGDHRSTLQVTCAGFRLTR